MTSSLICHPGLDMTSSLISNVGPNMTDSLICNVGLNMKGSLINNVQHGMTDSLICNAAPNMKGSLINNAAREWESFSFDVSERSRRFGICLGVVA